MTCVLFAKCSIVMLGFREVRPAIYEGALCGDWRGVWVIVETSIL